MGYTCTYFNNIMWFDSVWLAPLVLLGIDKMLTKQKDGLYILTLFMALLSNYYTAYMIVLFSVIYFFYELYTSTDSKHWILENKKTIIHFLFITLLIGLLISFILIPIFLESFDYMRIQENKKIINYNFLDLISGTYLGFGNLRNPLNYYGFLIYCGTVMLPLVACYFANDSISKREKKGTIIIFVLFLLPVIIKPFTIIWHLFTYPRGFNYRYSFLVTLFILMIAFKSFQNLKVSTKVIKYYYIIYFILSISLLYTNMNAPGYYMYLDNFKIIFTLIFLLINCVLLVKSKKKLILGLLVCELIINVGLIFNGGKFRPKNTVNLAISQELSEYCNINVRCDTTTPYTLNEGLLGNYNGTSLFLSSSNKRSLRVINKLNNVNGEQNYFKYLGSNTISDMLFGIEYVYDFNKNNHYEYIKFNEYDDVKLYLIKHPNTLGIGYTVSKNMGQLSFENKGIKAVNELLNVMDGSKKNYFIELKLEKINDKEYLLKKNKNYFEIYIVSKKGPINIDMDKFVVGDNYGVLYDDTNKDIKLEFASKEDNVKAYAIDYQKLEEFRNNRDVFIIENVTGNSIKGTIDVSKESTLMMTIPYEKGWTIYLDGKKVNYYEVMNSFVGIDVTEGNHLVEYYYEVPGLKIGLMLSLSSLIVLITYELKKRKTIY